MPRLNSRTLLSGPGMTLTRVACDGTDARRPVEERLDGARVLVTLTGRYVFRGKHVRAVASPAVALLLPDGVNYEIAHPHGEGDVTLAIGGTLAARIADSGPEARPLSTRGYVGIQRALAELASAESKSELARLAVEEEFCLALSPLPDPPSEATARDRERAAAIAHEVELRFDEPLPLAELAAAAGVSLFEACRVFRRVRGTTIHAYQRALRLRHALALLIETRIPLAELAVAAGFANQGHLGNRFRAEFGITPGRSRQSSGLRVIAG